MASPSPEFDEESFEKMRREGIVDYAYERERKRIEDKAAAALIAATTAENDQTEQHTYRRHSLLVTTGILAASSLILYVGSNLMPKKEDVVEDPSIIPVRTLVEQHACADELTAEATYREYRATVADNKAVKTSELQTANKYRKAAADAESRDIPCDSTLSVLPWKDVTPNFDVRKMRLQHECVGYLLSGIKVEQDQHTIPDSAEQVLSLKLQLATSHIIPC